MTNPAPTSFYQTAATEYEASSGTVDLSPGPGSFYIMSGTQIVYLGPYTEAPTLDPFGNPLVTGQLYFNSTNNQLYIYEHTGWASLVPQSANPSAEVGLTAIDGSASTFMTSDSAPALNVSISPTWSGTHTFAGSVPQITLGSSLADGGIKLITGGGGSEISLAVTSGNYNWNFPTSAGTAGAVLTSQGGSSSAMTWTNPVTSVAMTVPSDLTVTGSPITTTGTLAISRNSQSENLFLGSPNGSSGTPTYRAIVAADLPANGANPSGSVGLAAVNGSATTWMRSDAAPALSVAIVPTWSGHHTFSATVPQITLGANSGNAGGLILEGSTSGAVSLLTGAAAAGTYNFNLPTTAGTAGQCLTSQAGGSTAMTWSGGAANPTGTVGLAAVNGSATTWMRSDGAPALSVAITPTWTGAHIWSGTATFKSTTTPAPGTGGIEICGVATAPTLAANGAAVYLTAAGGLQVQGDGSTNDLQLVNKSGGAVLSVPTGTTTAQLGVAGTSTGALAVCGSTSGTITVQPQAAAGTYNFNLPTAAGTSGQHLTSGGGSSTAMTWTTAAMLHAKDYGATGNGSTDDTTALQNWINAVQTAGLVGYLDNGTYKVSSSLSITSAITLMGAGTYTAVLQPTSTITCIAINVANPVILRDFGISYPTQATAGAAITVTGTNYNEDSRFLNLQISNYFGGIDFVNAAGWVVDGCNFYTASGASYGITVACTYNADFGDSTICNTNITSNGGVAISQVSSGGLRVHNCKINGCTSGYQLDLTSGATTSDLLFVGNSVENFTTAGMTFIQPAAGTTFANVTISGNQFFSATPSTNCLNISDAATAIWLSSVSITGNTYTGPSSGAQAFVNCEGTQNLAVVGNTIFSNGGTTYRILLNGTTTGQYAVCAYNIGMGTGLTASAFGWTTGVTQIAT